MSIREGHDRKVSFDTEKELGNKIDELAVMIGKLATTNSQSGRQFKPQIHENRGRGQTEVTIRVAIRTGIDGIVVTEDNTGKTEVGYI